MELGKFEKVFFTTLKRQIFFVRRPQLPTYTHEMTHFFIILFEKSSNFLVMEAKIIATLIF